MSNASRQTFSLVGSSEGAFIRYLLLEPGQDQDPLVCQLCVAHIDGVPPFEALSYLWGRLEKVAEIECLGGQCLNITANLESLLRSVRRTEG